MPRRGPRYALLRSVGKDIAHTANGGSAPKLPVLIAEGAANQAKNVPGVRWQVVEIANGKHRVVWPEGVE